MEIDQLKLFVVAIQSALKNISGNVIFINYYALLSKHYITCDKYLRIRKHLISNIFLPFDRFRDDCTIINNRCCACQRHSRKSLLKNLK